MATKGDFAIEEPKLNLVQKLAAVGLEIDAVEKKGENKSKDGKINYKYVKAADVAKEIRDKLFSRNIILTCDEKEVTTVGLVKTYSGGEMPLLCVRADFTFRDGDSGETLTSGAFGVAMDGGDKAIYKAKTGALKYVLRGIALIPDEKDDPEHDITPDIVNDKIANAERAFDERESKQRIAPFRVSAIFEACKRTGKGEAIIVEKLGGMGYVQMEEVRNFEFDELLQWANTPNHVPADLEAPLKRSVEQATNKCVACGSRMIPAGVAKTGKPYPAFCSNKDCATRQKKQRVERTRVPIDLSDGPMPADEEVPF